MPRGIKHDQVGKKFGMLTILERIPGYKCICSCDCGSTGIVKPYHDVVSGHTQTCGCSKGRLISENRAIHGDARVHRTAPEYRVWRAMLQRCFAKHCEKYPIYGGRGITVCPEWRENYPKFLSDVGRRPTIQHTLDRFPDMNGNYEPSNVRWATKKEQARNTRTNRIIEAFGQRKTVAEWSEVFNIKPVIIYKRLRRGWSAEEALTKPPETPEEAMARKKAYAAEHGNRIGINAA